MIKAFLLISVMSVPLSALAQEATTMVETRSETVPGNLANTHLPFVVDPDLTMTSGADNLVSLQHHVARFEDERIGLRWFAENRAEGKAAGVALRLAKYTLIDLPVDYFTVVLGHEYFGHGARYRELNIGDVHYGFDAPPPYGNGGGEASISLEGNVISDHEILSIWSGGIESQPLIGRRLAERWMATGRMHYRDASLYFWSWQILYTYVNDSEEDLTAIPDENDPQAYVRILNNHEGFTDLSNLPFTVSDLKASMRMSMANPFLLYSIYVQLKTYLWDGKSTSTFPAIPLWGVEYLPLLRTGLTPFGPEYHLENYLRIGDRVALLDIRKGDQTFYRSWGGFGAVVQNIYQDESYSLDAGMETWKQPALEFGPQPSIADGGGWGTAGWLRGYYNFESGSVHLSWLGEIGYKSVGFLEGYPLDAGPHFLAGVAIRE